MLLEAQRATDVLVAMKQWKATTFFRTAGSMVNRPKPGRRSTVAKNTRGGNVIVSVTENMFIGT